MGNINLIYFNFIKKSQKEITLVYNLNLQRGKCGFSMTQVWKLTGTEDRKSLQYPEISWHIQDGGWKHGGFNIRHEPFPISQMHLRNSLNNWICHMHPQKSLKNHMPDRIQCYCRSYYTQFEELHTLSPQGSFHKNRSMADVRALF